MSAERPAAVARLCILVPLDGTLEAERSLLYARALAAATDGEILLVRAVGGWADAEQPSLGQTARTLRDAGLSVESELVTGESAAAAILGVEQRWRPDLIVMATTKPSMPDRWLNRGVTAAVVTAATVPVAVAPPDWIRPLSGRRPWRILVPLDGSRSAERALDAAARLANVLPADLVLLRVTHDRDGSEHGATEYLRATCARAQSAAPGRAILIRVRSGAVPTEIQRVASELAVDAIALCTHAARGPFGGTATDTVANAEVPVILVGPRAVI
jgi:nucleotide-binding universal stress UspA family protein